MVAELNIHGGDIYAYKKETGKKPLDYSANINPLGLSQEVIEALTTHMEDLCHYPDVKCTKLTEEVAAYENIHKDFLIFGNGAADLIYRLCYALKPKRALLPAPTFLEYEQALSLVGCESDYYYMKEKNEFRLDEDLLNSIAGKDIFFLCNPNNPTGMITDHKLLYKIASKCKEEQCILVIDECFIDFVSHKQKYSFIRYLHDFDNVIILKAFTKTFAMPGLRLGYCMSSNKDILKKILMAGQPWSVSVPAQIAGVAALRDKEYLKRTLELISMERKFLTISLTLIGFTVFRSYTNFILFQTKDENLYERLYKKGILIRKCQNFVGLDQYYYRIAVKDRKNNELLIASMK